MMTLQCLFGVLTLSLMTIFASVMGADSVQEEPWARKTLKQAKYTILYERDPKLCQMLVAYYERVHTDEVNRDWGDLPPVWKGQRPPSDEAIVRVRTPTTDEWMKAGIGDLDLIELDVDNDGLKEYLLEISGMLNSVSYDEAYIYKCKRGIAGCGELESFDWLLNPTSSLSVSGLTYTGVSTPIVGLQGSGFIYSNGELGLRGAGLHSYVFRYAGQTFVLQHPPLTFYKGAEVYVGRMENVVQLEAKAALWCAMKYEIAL